MRATAKLAQAERVEHKGYIALSLDAPADAVRALIDLTEDPGAGWARTHGPELIDCDAAAQVIQGAGQMVHLGDYLARDLHSALSRADRAFAFLGAVLLDPLAIKCLVALDDGRVPDRTVWAYASPGQEYPAMEPLRELLALRILRGRDGGRGGEWPVLVAGHDEVWGPDDEFDDGSDNVAAPRGWSRFHSVDVAEWWLAREDGKEVAR